MDSTLITIKIDSVSFTISSSTTSEAELRAIESQVNSMLSSFKASNPTTSVLEAALYTLFLETAEYAQKVKELQNLETVVNELKENRRREDDARRTSSTTSAQRPTQSPAKRPFQTVSTSGNKDS